MSARPGSGTGMKKTLGLTGVTVNAMALIAPGAFLWITYQLQAANTDVSGGSTAQDMWTGIVLALIIAFLTAFAFAELAHRYPDAGTGSAYYFAEKAFLDRPHAHHRRWARLAKFVTGWAAHLYYWVYPGVMVAFMATLVTYIAGQFGIDIPIVGQIAVACVFSALVGFIAVRGITGSTNAAIAINIVQLTALVAFSVLAILFRSQNPLAVRSDGWYFAHASEIVLPHKLAGLLFQATIAILILVGFETSTALGAEAKNPKRDIPRGVILSLIIQGLFAYLFEYFAANYALSDKLVAAGAEGKVLTGIDAAAAASAPIGDLAVQIGNSLLNGNGFALMIVIAITVGIAVLGTTLAAMNTAVRISFAMAQDKEMPDVLGMLHDEWATPYVGVVIMVIVSAAVAIVGLVGGVVTLTGITLASNLGTFALYGLICVVTFVAFVGTKDFDVFRHGVIPALGAMGNAVMVLSIFVVGIWTGGSTAASTFLALGISGLWLCVSVIYFVVTSRREGKAIIPAAVAMQFEK